MTLPPHEELWRDALTLGELIAKLIRERKHDTPEFKFLVRFYGKNRLKELYLEQLEREKTRKGS